MRPRQRDYARLFFTVWLVVGIALLARACDPRGVGAEPDEVSILAGAICAEGCLQPAPALQLMARTILEEAIRRHITLYELVTETGYLTAYKYARAHPNGWQMAAFVSPPEWAYSIAADVYAGAHRDLYPGVRYFDGLQPIQVFEIDYGWRQIWRCPPNPVWDTLGRVPFTVRIGEVCFYGAHAD